MDITKLALQDEATINIDMPDGSPSGITIALCSSETEQYQKAAKKLRNARLKMSRDGEETEMDSIERQSAQFIADCIVSWEGLEKDGEPFPCTAKNAFELFSKHRWLKEKVDRELANTANFMQR